MSSMAIKELSSMLSRNVATSVGSAGKQSDAVSFESVWSNQTEKNNSAEVETSETKTEKKEDASVRDSLKTKDARKESVKSVKDVEETTSKKLDEMTPEELEQAMEVLGTTAVEMIRQIADAFDMTVEEVQAVMSELGMEQMDVLQQGKLGALLLAVAGVDNAASLITDGELYQKYQALMEQMNAMMEQCSEELQMPVEDLEELVDAEALPVEIVVDDEIPVEETVSDRNVTSAEEQNPMNSMGVTDKMQTNQQMQSQTESQANSGQETDDKGQNVNLMLQNLKEQRFEPQMQQITQTTSGWDVDTMDIMRQIMDYMKIQVKPDMSNLEMQLHPESLGTLQVNVASKGGVVTAQFVTQNETVKAVLESQMIQLKESFAEQGVKVEAVEVTVQTHQFDQNLEQGRNRQSSEPDKKSKTRRIQLNGDLTMETLEGLEEDEQLAAEMMAANGNTVDYTA